MVGLKGPAMDKETRLKKRALERMPKRVKHRLLGHAVSQRSVGAAMLPFAFCPLLLSAGNLPRPRRDKGAP